MELRIQADSLSPGSLPTMVRIRTEENPFTFFLRDVSKETPIYIPEYHVAATTADDSRGFIDIHMTLPARDSRVNLIESTRSRRNRSNRLRPVAAGYNATNGTYSALSSETYRNIAFYNSMGLHDQARRCLDFFLEKQHKDGFIQTFTGYMLENGAVLWSLSEHYRYTRDKDWLKKTTPKILRACEYLLGGSTGASHQ